MHRSSFAATLKQFCRSPRPSRPSSSTTRPRCMRCEHRIRFMPRHPTDRDRMEGTRIAESGLVLVILTQSSVMSVRGYFSPSPSSSTCLLTSSFIDNVPALPIRARWNDESSLPVRPCPSFVRRRRLNSPARSVMRIMSSPFVFFPLALLLRRPRPRPSLRRVTAAISFSFPFDWIARGRKS